MIEDAVARFERQVRMVEMLRKEWLDLGEPLTAEGGATGRAIVVHPLVVAIQDAEMRAARLRRETFDKRKAGKPVGANAAPDRQPAAKLRAVS